MNTKDVLTGDKATISRAAWLQERVDAKFWSRWRNATTSRWSLSPFLPPTRACSMPRRKSARISMLRSIAR